MKLFLLSIVMSFSAASIAHDNVELKVGESAYFGATKVTCTGSTNISIWDAYKSLPYAHKLNI